jgi:hypothetical protein
MIGVSGVLEYLLAPLHSALNFKIGMITIPAFEKRVIIHRRAAKNAEKIVLMIAGERQGAINFFMAFLDFLFRV